MQSEEYIKGSVAYRKSHFQSASVTTKSSKIQISDETLASMSFEEVSKYLNPWDRRAFEFQLSFHFIDHIEAAWIASHESNSSILLNNPENNHTNSLDNDDDIVVPMKSILKPKSVLPPFNLNCLESLIRDIVNRETGLSPLYDFYNRTNPNV